MSGQTSVENGKKGGRPRATHTLQAERAKKQLIKAYIANIKPINKALIDKAIDGDIQAIRELHDRVYGRALQPFEGELKGNMIVKFLVQPEIAKKHAISS